MISCRGGSNHRSVRCCSIAFVHWPPQLQGCQLLKLSKNFNMSVPCTNWVLQLSGTLCSGPLMSMIFKQRTHVPRHHSNVWDQVSSVVKAVMWCGNAFSRSNTCSRSTTHSECLTYVISSSAARCPVFGILQVQSTKKHECIFIEWNNETA